MSEALVQIFLPLILMFIMFSLGLGLTIADFLRVFSVPKAFFIGLFNQVVILPATAFSLALLFKLPPELAVGIIILSLSPGGVSSNILTRIAGGSTPLSISLTAIVTLLSVVTIPFLLSVALHYFSISGASDVDTLALSLKLFFLTVIPVGIGMLVTRLAPKWVDHLSPIILKIGMVLFGLLIIPAIFANWSVLRENYGTLGPVVIALNVILLGIGVLTAHLAGLDGKQATTIALESGIQNGALGVAVATIVATQVLGETVGIQSFALPSAIYGLTMYLVSIPFAFWRRGLHQNYTFST